ncbi:MAG: DUF2971 domain-containing protein [Desulfuromonadales bacterium]|nr:DUF2971 domain-containing protein [Desulfuromonadales bacterium]
MLGGLDRIIQGSKTIGVYSLSETPLDELLWAHYGDSHTGFCIEYNLEPLALGASYADKWMEKFWRTNTLNCFRIQYQDFVPEIHLGSVGSVNDDCDVFQTLLGYKSTRWNYEREVRIITPCAGAHHYNREVVTGIYFGLRMPEDRKTVLMQRLHGRPISYYQIEQSSGSYGFSARKLFTTESPN